MAGSKFKSIFEAREGEPNPPEPERGSEHPNPQVSEPSASQVSGDLSTRKAEPAGAKKGRPPGKRSDPDYDQFSVHLRKKTHRDVKIALLQEGQGREVSELVEELLTGWLADRP